MKHIVAFITIASLAACTSEDPQPVGTSKLATVQDVNDPDFCEVQIRQPVCELELCPGFTQSCIVGFDYSDLDCDGFLNEDLRTNEVDNCMRVCNPDQTNSDDDRFGDACDPCPFDPADDIDKDGICGDTDNCPAHYNPQQEDADSDGFGDPCDQSEATPVS